MPFNQLLSSLKILEERIKDGDKNNPYVILTFDAKINAAIRVEYNRKTKNVSITCTDAYLEIVAGKLGIDG